MPDRDGRPLRQGDRIITSSESKGLVIGELLYDEEAKKSYHIKIDGVDRPFYPLKPWRGGNNKHILNLTLYVQDQLDNGLLDLIH